MKQSEYGVVCQFKDGSEKNFNLMTDFDVTEAEFMFLALSHLSREDLKQLKMLGCLHIGKGEDYPAGTKPPYHWIIDSKLIDVNRYHFVV